MKNILILSTIVFLSFSSINAQADWTGHYRLADKIKVTLGGDITFSSTDYSTSESGLMGRLSATYFPFDFSGSALGIKFTGAYGNIKGKTDTPPVYTSPNFKTDIAYFGGSLVYSFALSHDFLPYISAGASYLIFNPKDQNRNVLPGTGGTTISKRDLLYNGELGFDWFLADRFGLNFSFGINITPNDLLEGVALDTPGDWFYTAGLGLSYSLFGRDELPIKLPPRVIPQVSDEDKDGIPDEADKCPQTPSGVSVDKNGCPLDSDSDGVADYNDDCPNTPLKVQVDKNGCPLDSDNDGIVDYLDECPGTIAGTEVNEYGCEVLKEEPPAPEPEPVSEYNLNNERLLNDMIFTDGNSYCFQVSSWQPRALAEREVQKLAFQGHKAYVHEMNIPEKGGIWNRVRIGYFSTFDEAMKYRKEFFSRINLPENKVYFEKRNKTD